MSESQLTEEREEELHPRYDRVAAWHDAAQERRKHEFHRDIPGRPPGRG